MRGRKRLYLLGQTATILAFVLGLWEVLRDDRRSAVELVLLGSLLIASAVWALRPHKPEPTESKYARQTTGRRWLFVVFGVQAALFGLTEMQARPGTRPATVESLLDGNCWIGYDPPYVVPNSMSDLLLDSVVRDMAAVKRGGFTGIVTFGSAGSLAEIPRIAKAEKLAVIMGIWDASNAREIDAAIHQSAAADAYSVGHDGLVGGRYNIEQLTAAIRHIRRHTGRPVTASEQARFYQGDPRLASLGDWIFPVVHSTMRSAPNSQETADVTRDVLLGLAVARDMANLAMGSGRPLMLKAVTYPWNGAVGASVSAQAAYHAALLDGLRSPEFGASRRVRVVVHSAFDAPWKKGYPFWSWDPYTGLFDLQRQPRPAVSEVTSRCQ